MIGNSVKIRTRKSLASIGQNWPDVLVPFVNNYKIHLTASFVSRTVGIPRRTVSRILNGLANLNLIRYVYEGKNKKFYLDLTDQRIKLIIRFIEGFKAIKFSLRHKEVYVILEEIIGMRDVVLFGSYVKENFTSESDIDLYVIGNKSKKVTEIVHRQSKSINIHFASIDEFGLMLKNKKVLALEIMKSHIVFGDGKFLDLCWRFYRNEL